MSTSTSLSTAHTTGVRGLALRAGTLAAVGSVIAVELVAVMGKALGAPAVSGLTPPPLAVFTIVGVAVATTAWVLIGRRPGGARLLRVLVPVVLVVSFVPDVLLGVGGTAWSAVVTLMLAHLAVFLVTIPVLLKMLAPSRLTR